MNNAYEYDVEIYPNLFEVTFIPKTADQKLIDVYKAVDIRCLAIKNGKVAMRFSSTNRVTKYGLLQDAVCRCCNYKKGYKSYKGYIWEYEENYYR